MMDVIKAETALDTETVVVGGAVTPLSVDDLFVLDLIGGLTTDAAERAQGINLPVRIVDARLMLVEQRRGHQRACRARLHAFAATQVDSPIGSSKSKTILEP